MTPPGQSPDLRQRLELEAPDNNFAPFFYIDGALFAFELTALGKQWMYACHRSEIPAGGWLERNLFGQSVLLGRSDETGLRAFYNVCRHRGSPILEADAKQAAGKLTCPYHGWSYGSCGKLEAAPSHAGAEAASIGLVPLSAFELEGMVFVAFSEVEPPSTALLERTVARLFKLHGLADAKVAAHFQVSVQANWKLAVENFLECYHCLGNHPQLCAVYDHVLVSASTGAANRQAYVRKVVDWSRRAQKAGTPIPAMRGIQVDQHQFALGFRHGIGSGFDTAGETGAPLAPLMGEFKGYDGGETFGVVGPFLNFSLCNDHGVIIRVNPRGPELTHVEVTWLVACDAQACIDYDEETLCWLWKNTVQQDCELIQRTQGGIHSRGYRPGPYAELESDLRIFKSWYLRELTAALAELETANMHIS